MNITPKEQLFNEVYRKSTESMVEAYDKKAEGVYILVGKEFVFVPLKDVNYKGQSLEAYLQSIENKIVKLNKAIELLASKISESEVL